MRASQANARAQLEGVLRAALAAVDPEAAVRRALWRSQGRLSIAGRPLPDGAGLVVLAVGKAAAAMARAVEAVAGDRIRAGLVITKEGHGLPLERLALREASHPFPDARGEAAAREALALAGVAGREDCLLVLLSGGASALCSCPLPGLCREDLTVTTRALLESGADIEETNAVRKHLTELSGGRLAARAACARIEVLVVSDVLGDRLDVIGSGPCAPDPSRFADALAVLEGRGIRGAVPEPVSAFLERGARGAVEETPKPGDRRLAAVRHTLVACNDDALAAAERAVREQGLQPAVLGPVLRGEAREVAGRLVALAGGVSSRRAVCLIAGGETVVTVRGSGRGGRNQELALAAAVAMAARGDARLAILAAGTDGSDGPTDAAGAFADSGTVERAALRGLSAERALADNDAYSFFAGEGGLLVTGPTRTNVMDLAFILVQPD
jgi:hydroxypyruvate reductase